MASAMTFGLAATTAPPAEAYPVGYVWLNFGYWNCPSGGSINAVYGAVDNVWSGGDAGDNVLWVRADFNRQNVFNGWGYCSRPWWQGGTYRVNIVWKTFWPRYQGQGFWL